MISLTPLRESWRNLYSSKLRSFLALLGILVGTGSVVALISSSELATNHALAQFKSLGTNILAVSISADYSKKSAQNYKLSLKDLQILKQKVPAIESQAPYITSYSSLSNKGNNLNGSVIGVTQDFYKTMHLQMLNGRFISNLDNSNSFATIGNKMATQISKLDIQRAYGSLISAGNQVYQTVGILKSWPQNMFIFSDINDSALIPIKLAMELDSHASINNIIFRLNPKANLTLTQAKIQKYLQSLLIGQHIYFRNPKQIIKIISKQRSTFTLLLGMIGGIALIVGGIGVMNIMLVSVIERKREIGLRLAVGAKQRDIRLMFLIEGVTLTIIGGLLGIIIGTVITLILAKSSGWQYEFIPLPVILGFSVSVAVGILSTIYPAHRASLSDPVVCLTQD
jgi:putative ABC transport system permease protein